MIDSGQTPGTHPAPANGACAEEQPLHAAWAVAWLREYRCHTRYLSLLAQDLVEDLELRFAWLDWWNATCVCREALRRLEGLHVEL
jgi:hypothetical protein